MDRIKPIPRSINGWQLDSQLELGWAAYMLFYKWDVEHEPEGYKSGDVLYRPDFLLHGVNIIDDKQPCHSIYNADVFIEVKGDPKRLGDAYKKADVMRRSGYNTLIVGKFPSGINNKEILQDWRKAQISNYNYSTYTLFLAASKCGGTTPEYQQCLKCFQTEGEISKKYDPEKWNIYYKNLLNIQICPNTPRILRNKYLWVGRQCEPIIGTWHSVSNRTDGDPGNTVEALKYANQTMSYKKEVNYGN